jgi:hypothetical protein
MLNKILFSQEEIEKMDIPDLINQINVFWNMQRKRAVEAEILMDDCEKLEKQMIKMLDRMMEIDPEGYKQYLEGFRKEEEDAKNLDNQ